MSQNTRFLCFNLGPEEFAIPLLSVREVLGMPDVTPVPQTPAHFLGIMNLRGKVISVMDLRLKLGIKSAASEETAVVILDFGSASIGLVVDKVNSVQDIPEGEAAEKPSLENSKSNEYITGVFKKQDHLILTLDISKILSVEDRGAMTKSAPQAA